MSDHVTIWVASVDTRNFEFDAFGKTQEEALLALQVALIRHAKRCKLPRTFGIATMEDATCRMVATGQGYCDREPVYM